MIKAYAYHGTTEESAAAILSEGINPTALRSRDPGDFGAGFYLTGELERARDMGPVVLKVSVDFGKLCHIENPYGLAQVEPDSEDPAHMFKLLAFDDEGLMRTCHSSKTTEERTLSATMIALAFVRMGFAGIVTSTEDSETVIFDPSCVESVEVCDSVA